jgi:hypothetical protein
MNTPQTSLRKLDHAGMAASTLCAIHCIALPLLLGSLTATGLGWLRNEALDWVIVWSSLVIGLFGLMPAYRKVHRHKRCLWLFGSGMLAIVAGKFASAQSLPDTPFVVCGAALIVSAHAANRYFCSRCVHCGTEEGEIS